ncbi:hypothetical protein MMPV_002408 [Pyropia vietnamensis]
MIIRVRLPDGSPFRVHLDDRGPPPTLAAVRAAVVADGRVATSPPFGLAREPRCTVLYMPSEESRPLDTLGVRHGDWVYVAGQMVPPPAAVAGPGVNGTLAAAAAAGSSAAGANGTLGAAAGTPVVPGADKPGRCLHGPRGMCERCAPAEDARARYQAELAKWRGRGMSIAVLEALEALKFKIKAPEGDPAAASVSLDSAAAQSFQQYLASTGFGQQRYGVLYGTEALAPPKAAGEDAEDGDAGARMDTSAGDGGSGASGAGSVADAGPSEGEVRPKDVRVEVIYEPPQMGDGETYRLGEDSGDANGTAAGDTVSGSGSGGASVDMDSRAERLAGWLGLRQVGIVFSARPRRCLLSGRDVAVVAEAVLSVERRYGTAAAASFVAIVVTLAEDGQTLFEAYQVSEQAVAMVRAGVVKPAAEQKPNSGKLLTSEPVFVEGKEVTAVHTEFFLVNVRIRAHEGWLRSAFPVENRELAPQTVGHMASALDKGLPFYRRVSDFHLLLFLSNMLDMEVDMPRLAAAVAQQRELSPDEDGYRLMIEAIASPSGQ